MSLIKKKDLRAMSLEELEKKLYETENELNVVAAERKTRSRQQSPGRHKALKRFRARIITILSERGIKKY